MYWYIGQHIIFERKSIVPLNRTGNDHIGWSAMLY